MDKQVCFNIFMIYILPLLLGAAIRLPPGRGGPAAGEEGEEIRELRCSDLAVGCVPTGCAASRLNRF